jgi:tetratricopeptide (TPR) repeat protein
MGASLGNIGVVHVDKGDYDTALDYYGRSLAIQEELGDKRGMGYNLGNIGTVHKNKGDYNKALDYYGRSLAIQEELGDKAGMGGSLNNIGIVHSNKGDYDKTAEYLEKSFSIQKEIGLKELETTTYLYLSYKHLGKDYDVKEIHSLIKDAENIEFEVNFRLHQLLEDKSYLEAAYKQVQDNVSAMDDELAKKFLSYPIPKAVVEEYNKVFKK